ncbi:hypothetical protein HMPREF1986_00404 [Oribacterium sp. oral taxon 078 str. F0263]|nr:hypothetical protein HMPREF1986_00404 [Oribacterium sp. oral taxon 078 str. F0263]
MQGQRLFLFLSGSQRKFPGAAFEIMLDSGAGCDMICFEKFI